jgi:putative transposase
VITHRPEHLKSFDYRGRHRYFLTFCTHQRHNAFTVSERVELVMTHILRTSHDQRFEVIAYCFMPDHLHLLIEGSSDSSGCREFIARAKQLSGFYYAKAFGERLWQRYGYEHTLRHEEATLSVARYIVENPLRARLVQRVEDYPFVGSSVYTIEHIIEAVQMEPRRRRSG